MEGRRSMRYLNTLQKIKLTLPDRSLIKITAIKPLMSKLVMKALTHKYLMKKLQKNYLKIKPTSNSPCKVCNIKQKSQAGLFSVSNKMMYPQEQRSLQFKH